MTRPLDPLRLHDPESRAQLFTYVTSARWFAGKGRLAELTDLTPLPWLTDPAAWPGVRFEVAEIGYALDADPDDPEASATVGAHELYQLAVSYYQAPQPGLAHAEIGRFTDADLGPVVAYDAMQDPAACRLMVGLLLEEKTSRDDDVTVSFHLSEPGGLSAELEPQIFTGQQSNTSVMYGDVAMMKLFRRLELGHNLDIEIHDALTRSGVGDVATLFGWIEASWPLRLPGQDDTQLVTADLAMVVQKLASAEDGWGLALDSLQETESEGAEAFAEEARALGVALAEIHEALRSQFPTADVAGALVATTMTRRLRVAAGIAPALDAYVPGLDQAFAALEGTALPTQRLHGDFHLGQTLRTPDGWKIIDFEGEPVKTLAERAEPDNVWRDIAGMLRSFEYAAASVGGPHSAAWAEACRAAFLAGYAGGNLSATEAAVLRAYEADKAIYEVVYEVRNRPDWVSIPLAAVSTLSSASSSTPGSTASLTPSSED